MPKKHYMRGAAFCLVSVLAGVCSCLFGSNEARAQFERVAASPSGEGGATRWVQTGAPRRAVVRSSFVRYHR